MSMVPTIGEGPSTTPLPHPTTSPYCQTHMPDDIYGEHTQLRHQVVHLLSAARPAGRPLAASPWCSHTPMGYGQWTHELIMGLLIQAGIPTRNVAGPPNLGEVSGKPPAGKLVGNFLGLPFSMEVAHRPSGPTEACHAVTCPPSLGPRYPPHHFSF